jgi:hypothetical protein
MWTASQLSRHCAHHRILSNLGPPKPTRDKAAAKGTLFHVALASWHRSGVIPPTDDPDLTQWLQTMVDNGWAWPDGAELETAWGLSMWGTNVAVKETEPHVYAALDGEPLLTAGRADACWMSGDVLAVVDWKTGRTQADLARINLQVNAAGIALCQRYKASAYQPGIYYAREGRWDIGGEVARDSDDWRAALADVEAAAVLDEHPHPGDHCGSCWERKECSAVAP